LRNRSHCWVKLTILSAGVVDPDDPGCAAVPMDLVSSQPTVDRVPVSHRMTPPPSENAAPSATSAGPAPS
jgi:hypothetical protein